MPLVSPEPKHLHKLRHASPGEKHSRYRPPRPVCRSCGTKNEWHWVDNLRAGCLPALLAGCHPAAGFHPAPHEKSAYRRWCLLTIGSPPNMRCISRSSSAEAACRFLSFTTSSQSTPVTTPRMSTTSAAPKAMFVTTSQNVLGSLMPHPPVPPPETARSIRGPRGWRLPHRDACCRRRWCSRPPPPRG